MKSSELEIGGIYRLDGQHKRLKKIIRKFMHPDHHIEMLMVHNVGSSYAQEDRWAADVFSQRVVEKINQ